MTDPNKVIDLDFAEENPWYKFMLETIKLDNGKNKKPRGWHWFWGIYLLNSKIPSFPKLNLKEIQEKLPEKHWLKKIDDTSQASKTLDSLRDIPDHTSKAASVAILQNLLDEDGFLESPYEINLSGLFFEDDIDFSDFIFPIDVSFRYSEFSNGSDFNNTKFYTNVAFNHAIFSKSAFFMNATFFGHTIFTRVTFFDSALFTEAKFSYPIFFSNANFCKSAIFFNAIFSGWTSFTSAIFSDSALFDKIKISGRTSFRYVEFLKEAPSFYKADLYSNILWDESRWPILSKESNSIVVYQNKNSYENLASLMKSLDKYHDEHFFYRQEMRCRRWQASYPTKCFYWLYEFLSDYGYGLKQALWGWFLHIFLGAILIGVTTKSVYNKSCDLAGNFYLDMVVSFANAHGVLFLKDGALKKCYMKFNDLPVFNIIWGFQAVFGILFLFLLLLTLRIRFRLK